MFSYVVVNPMITAQIDCNCQVQWKADKPIRTTKLFLRQGLLLFSSQIMKQFCDTWRFVKKFIDGQPCKEFPILMEPENLFPFSRRPEIVSDPELVLFQLIYPHHISVVLIKRESQMKTVKSAIKIRNTARIY